MAERQSQPRGDLEAQISDNKDIKIVGLSSEEDRASVQPNGKHKGPSAIAFNEAPAQAEAAEDHHWLHPWHVDWRQHHVHLWTSNTLPHRSSDAHAIARAEAASWAQMTPLIAATLGPMAALLGVPSLTQKLHGQIINDPFDGSTTIVELAYPTINLVLSAVVMFFEVLGNLFLVLRFSNFHSKLMTWLSYICWVAKSIVGVANYIQFGIAHPETEDIVYLQGFWVSHEWFLNYTGWCLQHGCDCHHPRCSYLQPCFSPWTKQPRYCNTDC
jgi:hypothetical protein